MRMMRMMTNTNKKIQGGDTQYKSTSPRRMPHGIRRSLCLVMLILSFGSVTQVQAKKQTDWHQSLRNNKRTWHFQRKKKRKKNTLLPCSLESGLETLTHQITKATTSTTAATTSTTAATKQQQVQPSDKASTTSTIDVSNILQNLLASLASSIALIPEASVFAMTAGLHPTVGLGSTLIQGTISACLGGRPGLVSGASATVALLLQPVAAQHGHTALSATVVLAGLFQMALAATKSAQYMRVVPRAVMLGFVNGLAVKVVRAQVPHFQHPHGVWLRGKPLVYHCAMTAASALLIEGLPHLAASAAVPSSLVVLAAATVVANVYQLPIPRLSDLVGAQAFSGGVDTLFQALFPLAVRNENDGSIVSLLPPFGQVWRNTNTDWEMWWQSLVPTAMEMALVGLLQSLLTLQIIDSTTHTRGKNTRESFAQGAGNVLAGAVGGMGGSALLGQSLVNVRAGGTSRLASIAVSVFCLLGVVVFAPLLGNIPVAALVGLMLTVAHHTFSWDFVQDVYKGQVPIADIVIVVMVSWTTAVFNMAAAVALGVLASALRFAWQASCNMSATTSLSRSGGPQRIVYLRGPLFFGSTLPFSRLCEPTQQDREWAEKQKKILARRKNTSQPPISFRKPTRVVAIDFISCQVWDHAAIMALEALAKQYHDLGIQLSLRHLSADCREKLVECSDISDFSIILDVDPAHDPMYLVGEDPKTRK